MFVDPSRAVGVSLSLAGVLTLLVGTYLLFTGVAAIGFARARRLASPPAPAEWPLVTVVIPPQASTDAVLSVLQDCEYPADKLDILLFSDDPVSSASSEPGELPQIRLLPLSDPGASPADGLLPRVLDTAKGEILLHAPVDGEVSSEWIQSMVRHCRAHPPVVVGPTIIEHEDLFLPRLQALSHLGHIAWRIGGRHVGLPASYPSSHWAARLDWLNAHDNPASVFDAPFAEEPITFSPAPETVVAQPPASSFPTFFQRVVTGFAHTFRAPARSVVAQGISVWLLHTVLLLCGVVAVALPAWRQPTLLALLAKMGGDVLLTLPAAKQYGQRGLFRSLVPTELLLVITLPFAGLWALLRPPGTPKVDAL